MNKDVKIEQLIRKRYVGRTYKSFFCTEMIILDVKFKHGMATVLVDYQTHDKVYYYKHRQRICYEFATYFNTTVWQIRRPLKNEISEATSTLE
jgi:hypothetical protein